MNNDKLNILNLSFESKNKDFLKYYGIAKELYLIIKKENLYYNNKTTLPIIFSQKK